MMCVRREGQVRAVEEYVCEEKEDGLMSDEWYKMVTGLINQLRACTGVELKYQFVG